MILFAGRVCQRHEVPAGATVRPFTTDLVTLRKGDPYRDALGFEQVSDCDGAIAVELGQVFSAERLAVMLGQLGWKCRKR